MNEAKFNVLLYSDESQPAFFAVVYSAILLMNMPNMHLTVVQLKESIDSSMGIENDWINAWPISPTSEWIKDVMGGSDLVNESKYHEIITKINEIFAKRVVDIRHQVIYCNPSIPDTVDALLEYVTKKSIELIVMGTRGLTPLKGLIFGSLAYTLQNRSPVPVLLVKKLPEGFLDSYRLKTNLKVILK
jgi:hypothetical protein